MFFFLFFLFFLFYFLFFFLFFFFLFFVFFYFFFFFLLFLFCLFLLLLFLFFLFYFMFFLFLFFLISIFQFFFFFFFLVLLYPSSPSQMDKDGHTGSNIEPINGFNSISNTTVDTPSNLFMKDLWTKIFSECSLIVTKNENSISYLGARESNSSKKRIHGLALWALWKMFRTACSLAPMYLLSNSGPSIKNILFYF